jgi:fatty acid desaturase
MNKTDVLVADRSIMVSKDTRITLLFVVIGTALWLISGQFTSTKWIRWAILIGVGVITPTVLTERTDG